MKFQGRLTNSDSPASHRSHTRRESSVNDAAAVDTTGADEFDDFAEEQEDDDFGDFDDFDDGFQEPMEAVEDGPAEIQPSQPPTPPSVVRTPSSLNLQRKKC